MYRRVRIKLTFFYSLLFLLLFWALSFGLYTFMNHSLGQGYITQVQQRHNQVENDPFTQHVVVVTIAGNVALEQLERILLIIDGLLIFIIPIGGWFLTSKTLDPLQKNYEQQRQFVSDASHELRTPLSIISGEMEMALKRKRTLLDYKNIINSSKEEIDRLTNLVENLLYLAKGDRENAQVTFEKVDVTDLVGSILARHKLEAERKKIKIEFLLPEESLLINGQSAMLKILFNNLIDNAIKYTPQNGKIMVKIFKGIKEAIVEIKDNGIGVDVKEQEKIFDRFYRADPSRSRQKGFGLGLAISKSIVQWHKGRIFVSSSLNEGTTFSIHLLKNLGK